MLHSLDLENYRGFQRFRLDGLARVNLLVGKNNCGKTSVLEAVELLASESTPDVLAKIAVARGETALARPQADRPQQLRPLATHFFHGRSFVPGSVCFSIGNGDDKPHVRLEVSVRSADKMTGHGEVPIAGPELPYEPWVIATTKIENDFIKQQSKSAVSGQGALLEFSGSDRTVFYAPDPQHLSQLRLVPASHFITTDSLQPRQMSDMWNQVLLEGQESEVTEAMRILDPEIEKVFFLSGETAYRYGGGGIFVAMRNLQERVPLGSLGDGVRRLLALALSMVRAKGGILLVDEIDTGLHYSVMGDMWRLIIEGARQADIQVFATTHSFDCIRGLASVCENYPDLGREVSLQKIHCDLEKSVALDAEQIVLADKQEMETR